MTLFSNVRRLPQGRLDLMRRLHHMTLHPLHLSSSPLSPSPKVTTSPSPQVMTRYVQTLLLHRASIISTLLARVLLTKQKMFPSTNTPMRQPGNETTILSGGIIQVQGTRATGAIIQVRGTGATGAIIQVWGTGATGGIIRVKGTGATGGIIRVRGTGATAAIIRVRGTGATGDIIQVEGNEAITRLGVII